MRSISVVAASRITLLGWTLLVVLLLGWRSRAASACTCLPPKPPREALELATAVFSGKVVSQRLDDSGDVRIRFEVERVFKSAVDPVVELATAPSAAACGRSFSSGQSYLVYATGTPDGPLRDHACSRTQALLEAGPDLAALGPGRPPGATAAPLDAGPSREPPRIDPATPPPIPSGDRGCFIGENAHALDPSLCLGLWMLAGLRRRRGRGDSFESKTSPSSGR